MQLKLFKPEFHIPDVDMRNQPVYADSERTQDFDNFDSNILQGEETFSDTNEKETEDESPVERFIHDESLDRRKSKLHDRPLNRVQRSLTQAPYPQTVNGDGTPDIPQVQLHDNA